MIEVVLNDRLGKKVRTGGGEWHAAGLPFRVRMPICVLQIRVKCNEDDTIGDLKKMVAAQTGAASVHIVRSCTDMLMTIEHAALSLPPNGLSAYIVPPAGTRPEKIRIQKWYTGDRLGSWEQSMRMHAGSMRSAQSSHGAPAPAAVYKDHITLSDYE